MDWGMWYCITGTYLVFGFVCWAGIASPFEGVFPCPICGGRSAVCCIAVGEEACRVCEPWAYVERTGGPPAGSLCWGAAFCPRQVPIIYRVRSRAFGWESRARAGTLYKARQPCTPYLGAGCWYLDLSDFELPDCCSRRWSCCGVLTFIWTRHFGTKGKGSADGFAYW